MQPNSTISSVAELRGKRVIVAKGTSAHGHLLMELMKYDVPVSEVDVIYLQPSDAESAFLQTSADAWAIWDPFSAILAGRGYKVLTSAHQAGIYSAETGIASLDALADPYRNSIISDFIIRLARGYIWANNNTDAWAKAYAAATGLSVNDSLVSWRRGQRYPALLGEKDATALQKLADAFAQAKLIPDSPVMTEFTDERFNQSLATAVPATLTSP